MAKSKNNVRYEAEVKRHRRIMIAVVLFLLGLIMVFVGTMAFYQTQVNGSGSGTVLYWNFQANNSMTNFNISLAPEQTTRTVNATMAPGTSGSFTFTLSTSITADYTITFSGFTNIPANLKFYTDSSHSTETDITASGYSMTGTLNGGSTTTRTIYWAWPYGTSSSITADNASADKSISFTATVVGQQKQ